MIRVYGSASDPSSIPESIKFDTLLLNVVPLQRYQGCRIKSGRGTRYSLSVTNEFDGRF